MKMWTREVKISAQGYDAHLKKCMMHIKRRGRCMSEEGDKAHPRKCKPTSEYKIL
jgi:hypothetical protein